ncbi:class I SAM-dependent methyltransferase [Oceanobacillus iheyensis]|uniref:class I SAM-dependent methyltransferase n=1 Tax=Oceanobacillus iheyensis TaxID=182710 RepID=UPI00362B6979
MDEKSLVKKVFAQNSDAYIKSTTHANVKELEKMITWTVPNKGMLMLDIATGGGHVAKKYAPYVENVIAADLTPEMLQVARTHLRDYTNIQYVVADAENLPFLDESFDLVSCRIAAHHFPNPTKFIEEATRVLKSKGTFIFVDNISSEDNELDSYVNELEKLRDPSHIRSLKVSEWKQIISHYPLTMRKEQLHKKILPFQDWVERTVKDSSQKNAVESYLLDANTKVKDYLDVKQEKEQILSFSIDEWMAMYQKEAHS